MRRRVWLWVTPGVVLLGSCVGGGCSGEKWVVSSTSTTFDSAAEARFCDAVVALRIDRPASYFGSAEHIADLEALREVAPPEIAADIETFRRYAASISASGPPATWDPQAFPPSVQVAMAETLAGVAEMCGEESLLPTQ